MRAKNSGIWDMGKSSGIWDMGLRLLIFNTKFTYCEAYGAPLLLIYLQAISIPIYVLQVFILLPIWAFWSLSGHYMIIGC